MAEKKQVKIREDLLNKIINDLEGSISSVDSICCNYGLEGEEELSQEEIEYIDSKIFRCEDCEWWYSSDEVMDDLGRCLNCSEGGNDEDEDELESDIKKSEKKIEFG